MRNKEQILTPYFIGGLCILLLNDFYLKQEFGNFLTGKLSDFAGLLVFPIFIAALAPKLKKTAALITGAGFILWKLPLMTPVIDWINGVTDLGVCRIIDYTDYMALAILPLSHFLINREESQPAIPSSYIKFVSKFALLGVSSFAFCATSIAPRYIYEMPQGTVYIGKSYTIKLPKDSIISSIRNLGYNCDYHDEFIYFNDVRLLSDTTDRLDQRGYYQTDNITRYWIGTNNRDTLSTDTIANIKYDLIAITPHKTRLTLINVALPKEGNIQDWRTLKTLSGEYKKWLKKNLIEEIE